MNKWVAIFIVPALLFCISCGIINPSSFRYNRYDNNGLMTGWWISKEDTAYIEVVKYRKGFRDGKSIKLFTNGKYLICHYKHGKLNGIEKLYSGEGVLTETILFKNDSLIKDNIRPVKQINWHKYRII